MDVPERVGFGSRCVWWDSIECAVRTEGVLCCPHCGGRLEERSGTSWLFFATERMRKDNDPDFLRFIAWLRGKCFDNVATARTHFDWASGA